MPSTEPIAVISNKKQFKKPDDAAHKKFLQDLNQKIDDLKSQQVNN